MNYGLLLISGAADEKGPHAYIKIVQELTEQEHGDYTALLGQILALRHDMVYPYVDANYRAWLAANEEHARQQGQRLTLGARSPLPTAMFDLTVTLLNWLSAFRMFIDQTEHVLSTKYGSRSSELQEFKRAQAREYDSVFGYRLLFRLRNYAQHRGLPLHGSTAGARFSPRLADTKAGQRIRVERQFRVVVERNKLLKERDVWSTVAAEIENHPDTFEINQYVDEAMQSIQRLAALSERTIATKIRAAFTTISSLREYFSTEPGLRVIGSYEAQPNGGVGFSFSQLDIDAVSALEQRLFSPLPPQD